MPMYDNYKISSEELELLEAVRKEAKQARSMPKNNKNDEFDYHMNDDLGRMVLNPDVVVRSRGVMEKCSFCIQMTQKTILDAKLEGREVREDEWSCACSDACESGAMVFGDINEEK